MIFFAAKLVGFASLSSEIVEDDIDRTPSFIVLTSSLVKEVFAHSGQDFSGAEVFSIQTDRGSRDVAAVELEMARLVPSSAIASVHATAPVAAKADCSLKPIGIALGVPVGVIVGRWLWVLFARQIYAVPEPTVPVVTVILVGIGGVVLANIVAAIPARVAARTPTALMLRAE